jgi:hypothetical protein
MTQTLFSDIKKAAFFNWTIYYNIHGVSDMAWPFSVENKFICHKKPYFATRQTHIFWRKPPWANRALSSSSTAFGNLCYGPESYMTKLNIQHFEFWILIEIYRFYRLQFFEKNDKFWIYRFIEIFRKRHSLIPTIPTIPRDLESFTVS